MSQEPSQFNGGINTLVGSVKESFGGMMGNDTMKAEGAETKAAGEAEKKAVKDNIYSEGAKLTEQGKAKEEAGLIQGDPRLQELGKADKTQGMGQTASSF